MNPITEFRLLNKRVLYFERSGISKSRYSIFIKGIFMAWPPSSIILSVISSCLSLFLVTSIFFPNNGIFSNHFIFFFKFTTSPIIIITGALTLFSLTVSTIALNVPVYVSCFAVVPFFMTAAGVLGFFPYFSKFATIFSRFPSPIRKTRVPSSFAIVG